jgi:hypothetical protein
MLLAAAPVSWAFPVAAWWTDFGPQIVLQNTTTGELRYSACNSYDTPIYDPVGDAVFSLKFKPRNGTALAGAGWWDSTTPT